MCGRQGDKNDQIVFLTWRLGDVRGMKEAAPDYRNDLLLFWSPGSTGAGEKLKAALNPAV